MIVEINWKTFKPQLSIYNLADFPRKLFKLTHLDCVQFLEGKDEIPF